MAKTNPIRAEFLRLKDECERLRADVDALREQVCAQRDELKIQFTRIAEMQAILDEEHAANTRLTEPRPLFPTKH